MGNKDKTNIKIDRQICIEYQLKLRELAYNLLNSKTIFELDQNRLIAIKYIYEDKQLKSIFESNLKKFEENFKTKKYKDAIKCIYKNIKTAVHDLAAQNKQNLYCNENDENSLVIISSLNNTINFKYQDFPLLGIFESCSYSTSVLLPTLKVYNSIYLFYRNKGQNVINNIIYPSLYNRLLSTYNIDEFNSSVDYIIEESKLEYYLASISFESEYSISKDVCNNFSLKFKIEIISTALCQVLLSFEQYILENCNIANDTYDIDKKIFKLKYNGDNDTFYLNNNELKLTDAEKYTLKEIIKPMNMQPHNEKRKHSSNATNINKKINELLDKNSKISFIISETKKFYKFDENLIQVV